MESRKESAKARRTLAGLCFSSSGCSAFGPASENIAVIRKAPRQDPTIPRRLQYLIHDAHALKQVPSPAICVFYAALAGFSHGSACDAGGLVHALDGFDLFRSGFGFQVFPHGGFGASVKGDFFFVDVRAAPTFRSFSSSAVRMISQISTSRLRPLRSARRSSSRINLGSTLRMRSCAISKA